MRECITREAALAALRKYNQEPFHLQHALTVEGVMRWYAQELGYGEEADFWATVGLLHDIDFEQWPEQHCQKAPELLREAGCAVTVTLRTYRHGETVVPAGCGVVPYDDRFSAMEGMDLVLSATTSPHYTVTAEQMSMLKRRPSWVVDLSMPRDVDAGVGAIPGITLYNVDTLGAEQHRGEIPVEVLDILDDYMGRFYEWHNYRKCLPAIENLKEAITERVLTYPELEDGLEQEELVELTVSKAVDLLTGGLKEHFTPEDLERVVGKIKVHTAVRSRERENCHGEKRILFPAIC